MRIGFSLFFVGLFLWGCNHKEFNSESDLFDYIKDGANGYSHSKTINGIDFNLMYRPTDAIVNQELGGEISEEKVNKLRNKYKNYMYFNLRMGKNNKELLSAQPKSRDEFGAMVSQLAFGMKDKVYLYTPSLDTLEMTDFIYPRMYGMTDATTIMFVFPRDDKYLNEEYLNFSIQDLGLYTGDVRFKVPVDKLLKEPTLSFKN